MDVGLVCDACSALTPIGVPQCARCGQPVALDPRPRRSSAQPQTAPSGNGAQQPFTTAQGSAIGTTCSKCSGIVPPNFKFCPTCGVKQTPMQNFDVQTRVGPRQA